MQLSQYDTVYFLGIGGIGMSALARWFNKQGMFVAGYDRTPTPLTNELEKEGIKIHFDDDVALIPARVDNQKTLFVYTPAIPKDHKEYNYLKGKGYAILKRSEVLGLITKSHKTIAVAGTHGKTTTSSLITHILKVAGVNMVAFLGGVTTNYASNLISEGEANENTIVVAEADEFDRSFLKLFPDIAVITSVDPDHLDIYGNHQEVIKSFTDFTRQINKGGLLVKHESIRAIDNELDGVEVNTYGMSRGQFFASRITTEGGFFEFNLVGYASEIEKIKLGVPGFHNMENAIAATIVAKHLGVDDASIKKALGSYTGVKRRFEFIIKRDDLVYIDDYAHHPTEITAFLSSLRAMYPGKKITAVFQPHLYSRTRDFAEGFSKSLSIADEVLLMDIYPARELPIPGVSSDMLFDAITSTVKVRCTKNDVVQRVEDMDVEVIATIGAGDIDTCVGPLKELLESKYQKLA
ncbi:MAG TPA: UDP-N-acetylmuramate--L-alanine ligase [Cyclobacteriaceae bacterium]|nr:UDP-N-acetylmuramate--L-alanine ligase [Cyclobacteriaceae bacterium]HRK55065.1 UDP-N-acetylmuramate--L-alanine ligase [Cyclobacteriaceae bacterium]